MTITLATLSQATEQEVFDQVAKHLLTQGKKSQLIGANAINGGTHCAYRGENGTKCAAGSLISDDEYRTDMEGCCWAALVKLDYVIEVHSRLISELQGIHDHRHPDEWRVELEELANRYNLNTNVLVN